MIADDLKRKGLELLQQAVNDPTAEFRQGQWEAIEDLLLRRAKLLVVQRTGWGKSMVYFLTTRLMRGEDEHTRIREDGSRENLPVIPSSRLVSKDPEEDARLEAERRQEALLAAKILEEKGFGIEGDEPGGVQLNRFLALGGMDEE